MKGNIAGVLRCRDRPFMPIVHPLLGCSQEDARAMWKKAAAVQLQVLPASPRPYRKVRYTPSRSLFDHPAEKVRWTCRRRSQRAQRCNSCLTSPPSG